MHTYWKQRTCEVHRHTSMICVILSCGTPNHNCCCQWFPSCALHKHQVENDSLKCVAPSHSCVLGKTISLVTGLKDVWLNSLPNVAMFSVEHAPVTARLDSHPNIGWTSLTQVITTYIPPNHPYADDPSRAWATILLARDCVYVETGKLSGFNGRHSRHVD